MNRKALWAWACYDWANSAWATAVLSGFFPMLLRLFWRDGLSSSEVTLVLGLANGLSSLAVALAAPALGAWADRKGARKRALLAATALGVAATLALAAAPEGAWPLASASFALAAIGFALGNLFYDALLVHVAPAHLLERASSLGYGLGYVGGGLFFAGAAWAVAHAEASGAAGAVQAMLAAVAGSALWWGLFSLPVAAWVPEPASGGAKVSVREVFRELRARPAALGFLLAYFLYIDGLGAVIRMASDFGLAIGLRPGAMIAALLLVQFVAWPAAIVSGRLAERVGAVRVLLAELLVLTAACWAALGVRDAAAFFALAAVVGAVMGGAQALSRAVFARLAPAGESGGWFGFFNVFGKFASVIGPIWAGLAAWLAGEPRASAPAASLLVLAGWMVLWRLRKRLYSEASPGGSSTTRT